MSRSANLSRLLLSATIGFCLACSTARGESTESMLSKVPVAKGVVAVIGLPEGGAAQLVELAGNSELTFYFQSSDQQQLDEVRRLASQQGLLGRRIFANLAGATIGLADNLADCVFVSSAAASQVSSAETLRALRPRATAYRGGQPLLKPVPAGVDDWSHPYHGPDNNPQSTDQLVRGSFRTQFVQFPKFSPMPEQTVIAGGRIFKAMGHIAHKANQNEMLNTLLCINAYNGTILWRRPNPPGFMIHRNTMVATEDALYVGDDKSCKVIDAATGKTRSELVIREQDKISDGPVWKWMALQGDTLYALIGNLEVKVDTQKSDRRGLGHWPWGMWKGHDYGDPRKAFGFGRTIVAVNVKTGKRLWHYRDEDFLDARALCMKGGRIYCYAPEKFLACIDANDGKLLWKNSDKDLLQAIGPNGKAQHYVTGYATTCYMKCTDEHLLFAGPQRERLVVASARDGKLAWTYPTGNLQLVLREDGIWAAGPQKSQSGVQLDYKTGRVLAEFPARRACTRATGCADSIFFRANGGTVRVLTETNTAQHLDPMRPPCQDGVLISNGHLYWGPWMCGCQLSLYGNICLAPAGDPPSDAATADASAAEASAPSRLLQYGKLNNVASLKMNANDWPAYCGDNARSNVSGARLADQVELAWTRQACEQVLPTAPVAAGGFVFAADRSGAVRAWDSDGQPAWTFYTGGAVYYPPAIADGREFVGSADGRVYALEAATGRPLWSYQVATRQRWIPVFGSLISAYPVAGGVVVDQGTVYAAAGIAHYDGTHVVALDAASGGVKARNDTSGVLEPQVNNGISLQGNLQIVDRELRFLAGGVYEWARYDLNTLQCLNSPIQQVSSQYRTAFYPYYPNYGNFLSLEYTRDDGCTLSHDASYEGSLFSSLSLQQPLPPGIDKPRKEAARWIRRRGGTPPKTLWQDKRGQRFHSFIVARQRLLAAGQYDARPEERFLAAINIQDGSDAWRLPLPADAVKGGAAIDHQGRIYVTLGNGQLLCYRPK